MASCSAEMIWNRLVIAGGFTDFAEAEARSRGGVPGGRAEAVAEGGGLGLNDNLGAEGKEDEGFLGKPLRFGFAQDPEFDWMAETEGAERGEDEVEVDGKTETDEEEEDKKDDEKERAGKGETEEKEKCCVCRDNITASMESRDGSEGLEVETKKGRCGEWCLSKVCTTRLRRLSSSRGSDLVWRRESTIAPHTIKGRASRSESGMTASSRTLTWKSLEGS